MIRIGKLTSGHARALVGLEDSVSIANQVVEQALNVRQVENLIRRRKSNQLNDNYINPEILNLASQISSLVGLKSNIILKKNGGIIEINFDNLEELDSFVQRLNN
jgi:ParB family chromosome partitioning protein